MQLVKPSRSRKSWAICASIRFAILQPSGSNLDL